MAAKLARLRERGVDRWDLSALPANRLKMLARLDRRYTNQALQPTVRDATYVLDEILDNETDLTVLEHTTDHAGYTDLVFGLFDPLGMRFSPRLQDLGDPRIYQAAGGLTNDFERRACSGAGSTSTGSRRGGTRTSRRWSRSGRRSCSRRARTGGGRSRRTPGCRGSGASAPRGGTERFRKTVEARYAGERATRMVERAEQIAGVFQVKLGLWETLS
ncbi:Tn3 family transposase [Rubrivirga sp.]|uniref:Tn3 family transposase n=1 Tax=Rubrivirga sp. TaxID=1885344 RepID=UPI003B523F2A